MILYHFFFCDIIAKKLSACWPKCKDIFLRGIKILGILMDNLFGISEVRVGGIREEGKLNCELYFILTNYQMSIHETDNWQGPLNQDSTDTNEQGRS